MILVVCIVGKSKSGRTRLMEVLITELKKHGLRVGALKHHKHGDFEMDIEGKDTWKYEKAGADAVAISSSAKFALIKKVGGEMGIDYICRKFFTNEDIVLADGFTLSDKPRIIVTESSEDTESFNRGCEILAVVDAGFGCYDVDGIVSKVMNYIMQRKGVNL